LSFVLSMFVFPFSVINAFVNPNKTLI
jgi:hypothetical protein